MTLGFLPHLILKRKFFKRVILEISDLIHLAASPCISLRSGCHAVAFSVVELRFWIIFARTLLDDSEIGQYGAGAQCLIRFVTEDRKYVSVFTLDVHDCRDAALKAVRDSFSNQ